MHLFNFTDNQRELLAYQANNALFLSNKKIIIQKWVDYLNGKKKIKEQSLDAEFSHDLFVELLDYTEPPKSPHSYIRQRKNEANSGKPDATLGYFSMSGEDEVHAVFELKTVGVNLDKIQRGRKPEISPVQQAFDYANAHSERCRWIIVSNFEEIRIYHRSTGYLKYETFNFIELLTDDTLNRFLFILSSNQLFWRGDKKSPMDNLFEQRRALEKNITESFYRDYKRLRTELLYNIQQQNLNTLFEGKNINALQFLSVTQKLVDRLIFMCFVRFSLNIRNTLQESIDLVNKLPAHDDYLLWEIIKKLFKSYDIGYNAQIPPFNGGLFAPDSLLENLIVTNVYLEPFIKFILGYNFRSELNANILGHIFEQSISDLEEIKANIIANGGLFLMNASVDATSKTDLSKRKKEGVFYTPDYITHYIIENTVGQWIQEKEDALFLKHDEENKDYWQEYQNCLSQIKILDPACGSGAFLTQCFDFLWQKWQISIKELDKIENTNGHVVSKKDSFIFETSSTFNKDKIRKSIVENNLFGVDLNAESVEITKLSLWLLLANKDVPLPNLDKNIQQGNSLIDDPSVVEQDAFVWAERFEPILSKGGFDMIVSNPPYVSANNMSFQQRQYFNQSTLYKTLVGKWDLYIPFIERGLTLLKEGAYISYIVPYGLLNQPFGKQLRTMILDEFDLKTIADLHKEKIFADATVPTCIFVIKKGDNTEGVAIQHFVNKSFETSYSIEKNKFRNDDNIMFRTENIDLSYALLNKIRDNSDTLDTYYYVSTGAEIHGKEQRDDVGTLTSGYSKFDVLHKKPQAGFKKYIEGSSIPKSRRYGRYCFPKTDYFLDYDNNLDKMRSPKFKALFESPKLMIRRSAGLLGILATYDDTQYYASEKIIFLINKANLPEKHSEYDAHSNHDVKFALGIINSSLMNFYYHSVFGGFIDVYPNYLKALPLKNPNTVYYAPIVENVSNMLQYRKALQTLEDTFIDVLKADFPQLRINDKLEKWYELAWKDFVAELRKAKIPLSKKQEFDWIPVFNEKKDEATDLLTQINETDILINETVFTLYSLTETEKATVRKF